MKQQETIPSFQTKYQHVLHHSQTLPASALKIIPELVIFSNSQRPWDEPPPSDPESLAKSIQLQTLYKLTMPALYSLDWQEQLNSKAIQPLCGIVAFKQTDEAYHSIDQLICTWVESGGTRVVPLKSTTTKQKIDQFIKNVSALVVPQFRHESDLVFLNHLARLIEEHKDFPVLAIGNSALLLLSELKHSEQLKKKVNGQNKKGEELQVFATHASPFCSNLNLQTRLELESKFEIKSTGAELDLPSFLQLEHYEQLPVFALAKKKNDSWSILITKHQLLYLCFMDVRLDASSMSDIVLGHKIIINFMEEVRKRERKVDDKQLEVGHYKMVLKGQRYHYNCDMKIKL